jgi:hypothetical protein
MRIRNFILAFALCFAGLETGAWALQTEADLSEDPESSGGASVEASGKKLPLPERTYIIAGWSMFGGGWLLSAIVGMPVFGMSIDMCGPHDPSDDIYGMACGMSHVITGSFILIPLFGPFVSGVLVINGAQGAQKAFGAFLILDSLIQMTGFSLAVAGHVLAAKKKKQASAGARLKIFPLVSATGLGLAGSF